MITTSKTERINTLSKTFRKQSEIKLQLWMSIDFVALLFESLNKV